MWTWVNAIENAREAALPSEYLRARASAALRSARDAGGKDDPHGGAGRQPEPLAHRADRIEHRAVVRTGPAFERRRIGVGAAAADEARTIGLPLDRAAQPRAIHAKDVEAHHRRLVRRPRAAAENESGALRVELGLDEQLAECRVREVVFGAGQHYFDIAGDFELARLPAAIADRQPPDLHIVLGRHGDLELRLEIAVAAAERGLVQLEHRVELVGLLADWQVRCRPHALRPRVAQIDVVRAGVRRRILAAASDRHVAPHAVAAAGVA